jgi:hypothetical protein
MRYKAEQEIPVPLFYDSFAARLHFAAPPAILKQKG